MNKPFVDSLKAATAVGIVYVVVWLLTSILELGVVSYAMGALLG